MGIKARSIFTGQGYIREVPKAWRGLNWSCLNKLGPRLESLLEGWTGFSTENCVFFSEKKGSTFLGQPPIFKDATTPPPHHHLLNNSRTSNHTCQIINPMTSGQDKSKTKARQKQDLCQKYFFAVANWAIIVQVMFVSKLCQVWAANPKMGQM